MHQNTFSPFSLHARYFLLTREIGYLSLDMFLVQYSKHLRFFKQKDDSGLLPFAVLYGAAKQDRTADLILTKDALYLLSYSSKTVVT